MTYTVVWRPSAEATLADLWTTARDREAVARAADDIDAMLRTQPLTAGESRSSNTRFLAVSPLAVYFDVIEDDRMACVWSVWRTKD
jgi:plasmid stabilization system protein ParE